MPKILDDSRDPVKRQIGIELRRMQEEEPQKLAEFIATLDPKEAEELMYDDEIFLRDSQWIDLSDPAIIHLLMAGRGAGKAKSLKTLIFSQNKGFVPLSNIEVGDQIFDEEGNTCKVLATHDLWAEKAYRIHFSDKTYVDCCSEHLWTTWEHRDRKQFLRMPENKNATGMPKDWVNWRFYSKNPKVAPHGPKTRTTQEIVDSFWHSSRKDRNHSVPVTKPLKIKSKKLPLDPYLFGYWIGDGGTSSCNIACHEDDHMNLAQQINEAGYVVGNNKNPQILSILGMSADLKATGAFNNKKIPNVYLYNSVKNRLAFLQGLMDSDGYISPGGKMAEFCSKTKEHADAVHFLVASLGGKPRTTEGRAMFNGRDYGTKYRVYWNPSPEVNPFRLLRKREKVQFAESQAFRNCHRMMTHFEEIEPQFMRCLTVDSPSSLYLAGESLIPTHNTHTAAATLKRAVEKHGVKDILLLAVASRDFRATLVPAIIGRYPPNHPNRPYFSPAKASLLWPNGAVGTCIPSEAGIDAPRGLSTALIIGDECFMYGNNEEIIDQALLTMRLTPSIFIGMTTPKATPKAIEWTKMAENGDPTIKLYSESTLSNTANLSDAFINSVVKKYEGTRLYEQEVKGLLLLTNPGALWQIDTVMRNTIDHEDLPKMVKIAIGIDPAMMSKKSGSKSREPDRTGISVVGLGEDDRLYSLEGYTGSYTAREWVSKVCDLYDKYATLYPVRIVAEINIIGEEMLKMAFTENGRKDLHRYINPVFATQSKIQRATPFALMTEQNMVKFVKGEYLDLLSMELTTFTDTGGKSPDAMDAFCWAMSELKPAKKQYTVSREFII